MVALDNAVRRSGMSVSDDKRLEMVASCYVAAQMYIRAVTDAVTKVNVVHQEFERWRRTNDGRGEERAGADLMSEHEEWLGEGVRSMAVAHMNLAALSEAIRAVPHPASAEARNSRASLMQALLLYIRCASRLRKLLSDLGGKFGKNYARGGFYETTWTGMEAASLKRLVHSAGRHFETAARLIDTEVCETRLVKVQPIPTPHSIDSSATIAVPSAPSGKTDDSRGQVREQEGLKDQCRFESLNRLLLSSDSAGDAEPPPVCVHFGSGGSVEGRDMGQSSLIQQMDAVAERIKSLESERGNTVAKMKALERERDEAVAMARALEHDNKQAAATIQELERERKQAAATIQDLEHEKKQAAVTIQGLERGMAELGAVIAQASAKVDEMLKGGTTADI